MAEKWLINRLASKRHNGRFRQSRYAYDPMGYKRIRLERSDIQPHAMVKQEYNPEAKDWVTIVCQCAVCCAYRDAIAEFNYRRVQAMLNPEKPLIRKRSDKDKQFSNDRTSRELRGKTLTRTLTPDKIQTRT